MTAAAAGMSFAGRVVDGVLHAEVMAPSAGWVAVGLNPRPELAGSVLVMAAIRDGDLVVEEHIARPPTHPRRQDVGGTPGIQAARGEESAGTTRVSFSLRLDTGDGLLPPVAPGQPMYVTLAWSREDDFAHHSAERSQVPVVFP